MMKQLLLLATVLLCSLGAVAQTDLELAEYYYNNGEFEQARLYYDKIWKVNKTNKVYEKYLGCLLYTSPSPRD